MSRDQDIKQLVIKANVCTQRAYDAMLDGQVTLAVRNMDKVTDIRAVLRCLQNPRVDAWLLKTHKAYSMFLLVVLLANHNAMVEISGRSSNHRRRHCPRDRRM